MEAARLKEFLDGKVELYNNPSFIEGDPISIPHRFKSLQDIEIIGFWTAILSWGLRKTIINKALELCEIMDHSPLEFILYSSDKERRKLEKFSHRTFNGSDALCMVSFFQNYYSSYESLEEVFIHPATNKTDIVEEGINRLHSIFISQPDFLARTGKHIAAPFKKSSCKRINMFLRWMVRKDKNGIDFGLWHKIHPADLKIPLDIHVGRVARNIGLLQRKQADWKSVLELTEQLQLLDPNDPIKYDFALFGMGVMENKRNFL